MTQARSRIRAPWLWLVVALVLAGLGGGAYWFLRPKPTSAAPALETAWYALPSPSFGGVRGRSFPPPACGVDIS